jgi:serine phosphatase RsbU (regulator of sigma subunit)
VNSTSFEDEKNLDDWSGIGWFRMHFIVDSSLWNKPLAIRFYQSGASQLFLNGTLIYNIGTVSAESDESLNYLDRTPKVLTFPPKRKQVIAIRYSDFNPLGNYPKGFFVHFSEINNAITNTVANTRRFSIVQSIFTVLPLTLALIHFLLFLYFRRTRENAFYALFMISFALLSYSNFQIIFTTSVNLVRIHQLFVFISINLAGIFGILTSYWHAYRKIPKYFYVFPFISICFVTYVIINPDPSFSMFFIFFLILIGIEFVRAILVSFVKRPNQEWPIVIGFIALTFFIVYQILLDNNILQPIRNFDIVYVYGVLILGIAMSINLARDFARTNLELVEREKLSHEQEIERRILEADNKRKTMELEDARNLQLSMLPSEIPKPEYLDISVYMKTATEVGGDYYDFLYNEKELTIAIGDATGHGTKAGIMVALIKSLFNTMGNTFFIPDFFKHCTKMIRKMNFGMMYMSLLLIRIKENIVYMSAAGMPPIYLFRYSKKEVEEITIKGLPLGASLNAQYDQQRTELYPGDTMLLMTDGFAERFNKNKESLDFFRITEKYKSIGDQTPAKIIEELVNLGESWAEGYPQNDDITFVIVKYNRKESKKKTV